MKRDQGMKLERAREMALALVEILKPVCKPGYCRVAGSIRRLKPRPNDIEVVVHPLTFPMQSDLFATKTVTVNILDQVCDELLGKGTLEKRPDKNGRFCWGERIKRAIYFHQEEGWGDTYAPLDLFSCIEPAQWGVIFAIRTGPGGFNRLLVTSQRYGGACPLDRKVAGGQVWDMSPFSDMAQAKWAAMAAGKFVKDAQSHAVQTLNTPQEEDFFAALSVPCWLPERRTIARLRRYLQQK